MARGQESGDSRRGTEGRGRRRNPRRGVESGDSRRGTESGPARGFLGNEGGPAPRANPFALGQGLGLGREAGLVAPNLDTSGGPGGGSPLAPQAAPRNMQADIDAWMARMGLAGSGADANTGPSGMIDVGAQLAPYLQARELAKKNSLLAQQQIGQYGEAGKAEINAGYNVAAPEALKSIAAVQGLNREASAVPDEAVAAAQKYAADSGQQLTPGVLEDAARQKAGAAQIGAVSEANAIGAADMLNRGRAQGLESAATTTAGARTQVEQSLNSLLGEIGLKEAETRSAAEAQNAQMAASNSGRNDDRAFKLAQMRAELEANWNEAEGRPYNNQELAGMQQTTKQESDPYQSVLAKVGAYEQAHKGGSVETSGSDAGAVIRGALANSNGDPASAAVWAETALQDINVRRAARKPPLAPLSRRFVLGLVNEAFSPGSSTTTKQTAAGYS